MATIEWDHVANTRDKPRVINADQEVWVRDRILTAMRMALALQAQKGVRADDVLLQSGLRGIAEGAAVEVIHTLDLELGYVNLHKIESQ
jgi:hypothetical protein